MKLRLLWVGRTRDERLAALSREYVDRIRRYCRLEVSELRDPGRGSKDARARAEAEGRRITEAFRDGEFRIAFDERGEPMTSEAFAALLGQALEGSPSGATLIVGGPFGLTDEVRRGSRRICALSRMTLTHEMARLVVVDQVYRAFTILRGERYHH